MSEPIEVISLGAGTQSTVMLLMACEGTITPKPAAAIFADTGWEPQGVYEHLAWLEAVSTIPIHRVSAGNLFDDMMQEENAGRGRGYPYSEIPTFALSTRGKNAGKLMMGKRQCTQHYKIYPIRREVRRLLGYGLRGNPPAGAAVQWVGISKDEWHRQSDSRVQFVVNRFPLIELNLTRQDCIDWFAERYPDRELSKSSCVGCPFHSDRQWLELARQDPENMAKTVALDAWLRDPVRLARRTEPLTEYLHRSLRPLGEVLAILERQDREQAKLPGWDADGFGNECEGQCGV